MMFRAVVFLLCVLLASAGAARAEADGPDCFRVTGVAENDVLNIRGETSGVALTPRPADR